MSLPQSRNTTYSTLTVIKAADLNDIQDQIVALWQPTLIYPAWIVGSSASSPAWSDAGYGAAAASTDNTGVAELRTYFVGLRDGMRILRVRFRCSEGNATSNIRCGIYKHTGTGSPTLVGSTADSSGVGGGTKQDVLCDLGGSPEVIDETNHYMGIWKALGAGSSTRLAFMLRVDYDQV